MSTISDVRRNLQAATSGGGFFSRLFKRQTRPSMPQGFSGTAEQFERLLQHGRIVWSAVVQANVLLHTWGGGDAPANLVWSDDAFFDERPNDLAVIAQSVFQLKGASPKQPELAELARTVGNEANGVVSLPIPAQLTSGRRVLMTTTFVNRSCLPGGVLSGPVVPLLIDPADHGSSCVLPVAYWPASLAAQWREEARSAPPVGDVPEARKMHEARERNMAEAQEAADRGELIRITTAAAAQLRRVADGTSRVVEIRCVSEGTGYRNLLNLVEKQTPCVISCVSEGLRVQIPDELSVVLLQGTVIDYETSGTSEGFAIHNPNARPEK